MNSKHAFYGFVVFMMGGFASLPVVSNAGTVSVRSPSTTNFNVRLNSLKELRFKTTIPQKYDFSCGSAALATLLTFQYGKTVSEGEVFKQMFASGNKAKIRTQGFSLLDMRDYLKSHGYVANGFKLPLEKLEEEGLPAIVLLNDAGYRHFVVIKGMRYGRVLLGDPAKGTRVMSRKRFDALWQNKVLFVVSDNRGGAQFNRAEDWRIAPLAPLALGVPREGLYNTVMPRRGPGDF